MLRGESGTGKELIAHAIHYNSARAKKPFIKVSCAALPQDLIESELFGYEKGAFTGAQTTKKGRFELAAGGTLFLDEIGELNLATQVKLLRVLQEREFERLGSTETIRADLRLVAATNKDLEKAIAAGEFRDDLYYRLNVFAIFVPPLRSETRRAAARGLFSREFAREHGKNIKRISTPAIDMLARLSLARQRARARQCDRAGGGGLRLPGDPFTTCRPRCRQQKHPAPGRAQCCATLDRMKRRDARCLKSTRGNRAKAEAGVHHRTDLQLPVRKYGIDWKRFRS